jgi:MtN3 and saliva related transmembrane protein
VIIALGLLSGLLTTGAWLPQLLRTWRRGRADDISYGYLAVFAAGVLGWLAYGLLAAQPAVVVANLVTFTLIAALTLLKTRPRRPHGQNTPMSAPARPVLRAEGLGPNLDGAPANSTTRWHHLPTGRAGPDGYQKSPPPPKSPPPKSPPPKSPPPKSPPPKSPPSEG